MWIVHALKIATITSLTLAAIVLAVLFVAVHSIVKKGWNQ